MIEMVNWMNQLDPINERMRTVGNLAEALLRVKNNENATMAIERAIGLLLDSVGQVVHPDDLVYMTPCGVA